MATCPNCKQLLPPIAGKSQCARCGSVLFADLLAAANDSAGGYDGSLPGPASGKTADDRQIQATLVAGAAAAETDREPQSLPTPLSSSPAGALDRTLDSGMLPAGFGMPQDDSAQRPHANLDCTIDSTSFPPIDPGAQKPAIGRTAFAIDQTIDTLPVKPVSNGPAGKTHHNLDRTIDSLPPADAGPARTVDSGDFSIGAIGRTTDLGGNTEAIVARLTRMWSGQIGPQTSIATSLKTARGQTRQDSKVVIKTRTVGTKIEVSPRESDYELLDTIGEGGMGVVYAARQASIDRTVAIKMLKPDMARNADHRDKFLSEAVVTGDLDHPNIVPIYDLGANETGALFYSMKRVEGTPWSKVIQTKSVVDNVEILMKVADAIGFAHARGVIHRDIKPENVMLGDFGEVLMMDWGLALSTAAFRKAATVSQSVSMGGTPAYMAPEMASGPIDRIGPTSDVYLLGAVLFEIIAGQPPHTGKTVMECLVAAARNVIVPTEHTGELLQLALRAMAADPADRYPSVRDFQAAIREYQSHADSILLAVRAEDDLARAEADGDYQTYARAIFGFQEALALWEANPRAGGGLSRARQAYARQALVKADFELGLSLVDPKNPEEYPLHQRLAEGQRERDARQQRLKNAKRIAGAMAAAMALVVTIALVVINREKDRAVVAEVEAKQQRDNAVKAEGRARQSAQEAQESAEREKLAAQQARTAEAQSRIAETQARDAEAQALEAEGQARVAATQAREAEAQARRDRDLAQEAKNREEYEAYVARIGLVAAKVDENAFDKALELLAECRPEFRNWEWGRLKYLATQSVRDFAAPAPVDAVAFFPGEQQFAAGSWDGRVRIWNLGSGQTEREIAYGALYVNAVAVSPDGQLLAAGGNDANGYVKVWDARSGELKRTLSGHSDAVLSVAFSRDGRRLLTSSYDKTARLWDLATGRQLQVFRGHTWWVWSALFSPDEKRIVTASQDGKSIVWNVATGEPGPPFTGHVGPVYAANFSPDGRWVATGGYDKRVLVWDPAEVKPFDFQKVVGSEANPPLSFRELAGHSAAVRTLEFSRDGRLLVSGAHDNALGVWDFSHGKLLKTLRGHAGWVRSCALTADGSAVLSGSHDHLVKLWDIEGYAEQRVLRARLLDGHADAVLAAHFSPLGDTIVTASRDRTAKTWNPRSGQELRSFDEGHEFLTSTAIFFPGGKQALTAAADSTARVWDVQTGAQLLRLDHTGRSAAAAVSLDGRWILTGGNDKRARLWNAQSGELLRQLDPLKADITAVAFSPDAAWLFLGDATGHGRLVSREQDLPAKDLVGHSGRIVGATFTPDGQHLLTASSDKTVGQWDAATGREDRSRVLRHPEALTTMLLAPDGQHIVTLCDDGLVRLWDRATAKPIKTIQPDGGRPDSIALSPDGRRALITHSRERSVRQWDLGSGQSLPGPAAGGALIAQKAGQIWTAVYSPDGNHVLTVGGNAARLWETGTGLPGISFSPHGAVSSANFSPDGQRLVTASWDNTAKIWDVAAGRVISKLEGVHEGYVNCAVFSPNGTQVLTASDDGRAVLWNAARAESIGALEGHAGRVRSVAFSNDGKQALTAASDKTARIWNLEQRRTVRVLSGHAWGLLCAAFSGDGRRIITGSEDNTARLWNTETGETLLELKGHTAAVNWVALSPDGRRALTASQDNTAKLWDALTGKELLTLRGHNQEVTAADFSPDSLSALTASRDGTAIVWLGLDWREPADPSAPPPAKPESPAAVLPRARHAQLPTR